MKNKYTKKELRVLKNGPVELAKAVIQQWIDDGKPESDRESVEIWAAIVQEYDNGNV